MLHFIAIGCLVPFAVVVADFIVSESESFAEGRSLNILFIAFLAPFADLCGFHQFERLAFQFGIGNHHFAFVLFIRFALYGRKEFYFIRIAFALRIGQAVAFIKPFIVFAPKIQPVQ